MYIVQIHNYQHSQHLQPYTNIAAWRRHHAWNIWMQESTFSHHQTREAGWGGWKSTLLTKFSPRAGHYVLYYSQSRIMRARRYCQRTRQLCVPLSTFMPVSHYRGSPQDPPSSCSNSRGIPKGSTGDPLKCDTGIRRRRRRVFQFDGTLCHRSSLLHSGPTEVGVSTYFA